MESRLTRLAQIVSSVLWLLYYLVISTLLNLSFKDVELYILGIIVFIAIYFFVYMIEGKSPKWYSQFQRDTEEEDK